MNATNTNHNVIRVLEYIGRAFGTVVLLAPASFCVFGFLESFEPGNGLQWQIGYAAVGSAFLVGAITLLLRRITARNVGGLALLGAAMFGVFGLLASYSRGLPWQLSYGTSVCVCLLGAAALLRANETGRANAVQFLYYVLIFGLVGAFIRKFAIYWLILSLTWLAYHF